METDGVHTSAKAIQNMEAACTRFSLVVVDRLQNIDLEVRRVTDALETRQDGLRAEIANLRSEISLAGENDDMSWRQQRMEEASDELASVICRIRRIEETNIRYQRRRGTACLTEDHTAQMREYLSGAADDIKVYLVKAPEDIAPNSPVAPAGIGPGEFVQMREWMKGPAANYQSRISGLSPGTGYIANGVKFDGFSNGVFLEAKGPGYARFVKDGLFQLWFRGADDLVEQAQRQLQAADGYPVKWHFAEEIAANATRTLFQSRGISDIEIIFNP